MSYETKKSAAQDKANQSGKTTCIYETYEGYRVGFLTAKTLGSAQDIFEPHFKPGNVVLSDYWRKHDLVIAFYPTTPDRCWSVDVIRCDAAGIPVPYERVRNHRTSPNSKDKVVGCATVPASLLRTA